MPFPLNLWRRKGLKGITASNECKSEKSVFILVGISKVLKVAMPPSLP